MQYLLIVLDGAPDRPVKELGNKTPLEHAGMKNLNSIAKRAKAGMMHTVGKGIAPESDAAVFSLLSYDLAHYTGRGPLEALGAGLRIDSKTLAFRANFATIDKDRKVIDRRAGRDISIEEAKELEKEVNSIRLDANVWFKFKSTVGHRGVLVMRGEGLSPNVSNFDIGYVRKGNVSVAKSSYSLHLQKVMPLDGTKEAKYTAELVNSFIDLAIQKLSSSKVNKERKEKGKLEANALLLRDAGLGLPKVMPIGKKFGMKFAFIAEMPVETGIAKLLKMEPVRFATSHKPFTIAYYQDLAQAVIRSRQTCDFMYVHIKGPDEPGHDGNAVEKSRRLRLIDSGFFALLKNKMPKVVCVTSDHSTPCSLKAHSADPVPVVIYRQGEHGDGLSFTEQIDSKGSLGIFNGRELLNKMIKDKRIK